MRLLLLNSLVWFVAGLAAHAPLHAQEPNPQHGIKFDQPAVGSHIRQYAVSPQSIPINRRYDQLSSAERTKLHGWWEEMLPGDEPPFPKDGLKSVHDAIRKVQDKLAVTGQLLMIATVGTDGRVIEVKVIRSPSPEMAKFGAAVLMFIEFKPAVCSGQPCIMDFPFLYRFAVD